MKNHLNIQQCELQKRISETTFSSIYQFLDKQSGVIYLSERLKYTINDSSKFNLISFSREANTLSKISHPSVLKFIDYVPHDFFNQNKPMIITEYCSNGTLEDMLINNPSKLDDTAKLIIIYGIANCLLYLHSHNIVHNCISTKNIILDEELHPKLFNFNSSKNIKNKEDDEEEIYFPEINIFERNGRYIPPEIYGGNKYSMSSDIYSFSIVVYEILSGELAYSDIYDIYELIDKKNKERLPTNKGNINDHLYDLISRSCSKEPKLRPTIEEIISELKKAPQYYGNRLRNKEYEEYINILEHSPTTFDLTKQVFDVQSVLNSGIEFQRDSRQFFNFSDFFKDSSDLSHIINIDDYENLGFYLSNNSTSIYKIIDKKSGKWFNCQFSNANFEKDNYGSIIKLSYSIKKVTKLHHPCIVKYIGYSPLNFEHEFSPLIVTEYVKNESLEKILNLQRKNRGLIILNDTQKLINIYGIASAMMYLHANDVIVEEFNPQSILEDDYLFPKLCDFVAAKYFKSGDIQTIYDSNEDLKSLKVSKAGNVFSFGLIIYEMMTNQKPSFDNETDIFSPTFDDSFPACYKQLIEKCGSENPEERPNFGEIVEEIKKNPEFITEGVNKSDFQIYCDFVDNNNYELFDNYIEKFNILSKSGTFKKITLYEEKSIEIIGNSLDLNKFTPKEMKNNDENGFEGVVIEKETGTKCYARIFKKANVKNCREVNFICCLDHPSILNFIGYSPVDFKKNQCPVIITEYCSNGTLEDMLRNNPSKLDDTAKLIIIYGIANCLLYLHSHNIVHNCISTKNIILDEELHPKLFNFNSSKNIKNKNKDKESDDDEEEIYFPEINIFERNGRYIPPEIYGGNKCSMSSDIYSFSIVVYEILSGELAYSDIYDIYELIDKKNKELLPTNKGNINDHLYDLISRSCSKEPNLRPTIEEIISELKKAPQYYGSRLRNKEYEEYINILEHSPTTFDPTKRILKFKGYDNFINKAIDQNSPQVFNIDKYLNEHIGIDHILNIDDYIKGQKLEQNNGSECFKIKHKENQGEFFGKEPLNEYPKDDIESIIKLSYEISKLKKLDHPSINKYIGYSPINFEKEYRPIIITQYLPNYSLKYMLELERQNKSPSSWNMTKKLMNIYGIASAMAYLHSNDIVHHLLHPGNIYLDQYLLPKITDICPALNSQINIKAEEIRYMDPDVIDSDFLGTKENNVYSYAIIIYEMLTKEKFYEENFSFITLNFLLMGSRPSIPETIPDIYRDFIECCWSNKADERPTFDEIVKAIKQNLDDLIYDDMNANDLSAYINYIDNYFSNVKIEDFIDLDSDTFQTIEIHSKEKKTFSFNIDYLNLDKFDKERYINEGSFGVVYKVVNKEDGKEYAAKISKSEINEEIEDNMIINLAREVNILSKLDHPSILSFIGYSPRNFKNKPHPVIVTEFASGGTLEDAIELENNNLSKDGWNDTKKLINIYGIASSLQYLHSLNIIHRDLRPSNVLLDDSLFPKLADFGLSKEITDENIESKISSGFKGTPAYAAPEIWNNNEYTKACDVYAFAFTVFEIMTSQKCFPDIKGFYDLYMQVVRNNKRPKFEYPIHDCYQKLIKDCWSANPENRPSFDEIIHELETNPEFITDCVDKDEFLDYVDMIHQKNNDNNDIPMKLKQNNEVEYCKESCKRKSYIERDKVSEIDSQNMKIDEKVTEDDV